MVPHNPFSIWNFLSIITLLHFSIYFEANTITLQLIEVLFESQIKPKLQLLLLFIS